MSIEENKAVVGRWFTEFWGENFNSDVIDELASPDIDSSTHFTPRAVAVTRFGPSLPSSARRSRIWRSALPPI